MDNVLQSFINPFLGDGDGDGNDTTNLLKENAGTARGDESAFISRQERLED